MIAEYKFDNKPSLTYKIIGGVIDFYFILGDNPEQVTQEYTAVCISLLIFRIFHMFRHDPLEDVLT